MSCALVRTSASRLQICLGPLYYQKLVIRIIILTHPYRFQKSLTLPSRSRGSYLITDDITKQLPEIKNFKTGLLNLFVQHTSCALSLNENWDQDVRADMSDALDRIVPEDKKGQGLYRHDAEGSDDMPV